MAGVGCNEGFLPTKDTRSLFNPEIRRDENVDPMRFTKSEDRLLMAGISKYGEKRWDLISSEYLPSKKMEMINRRYCKLTVMACKDRVDAGGALRRMQKNPPRPESDTPDEPYWTFSDDVELYYGVHVKGRTFATLTDIMFPHLDRQILRKRYLNIERRFKTAELKSETDIEPVKAKKAPSAAKKEPNKSPTTAKGRGRGKLGGGRVAWLLLRLWPREVSVEAEKALSPSLKPFLKGEEGQWEPPQQRAGVSPYLQLTVSHLCLVWIRRGTST